MSNKFILAAALIAGVFLFDATAPTASALGHCRRSYAAYTPYNTGYAGYSSGYATPYSNSYYARPVVPYYGYSFSGYNNSPYIATSSYATNYGYGAYTPTYGYGR